MTQAVRLHCADTKESSLILTKAAGWLIAGAVATGVSGVSMVAAAPLGDAIHSAAHAPSENGKADAAREAHAPRGQKAEHAKAAHTAGDAVSTQNVANATAASKAVSANNLSNTAVAEAKHDAATSSEDSHVNKVAEALATYYKVDLSVVEALHEQGYGYGEIAKAFALGKTTLADAKKALEGEIESAHTTNLGAIVSGRAADAKAATAANAGAKASDAKPATVPTAATAQHGKSAGKSQAEAHRPADAGSAAQAKTGK
jgi:hypothetical protein